MENTTMTTGTAAMSTSRTRVRIERSPSAHLLAPTFGNARGRTLSIAGFTQGNQGGHARVLVAGYAPSATDRMIAIPVRTTTTTPFMDVDHLRSGRPPV